MLHGLLGSKSVAKILLFLFVNEKCYGSQIQTFLKTPLTPIQKSLQRLESDGILISHFEGKLRIYQLSPTYPLRGELELLLKKAYSLLSSQEKKLYCFIHKTRIPFQEELLRNRDKKKELLKFWDRLATVRELSFSTKSRQGREQTVKIGKAEVDVLKTSSTVLVFQEKGYWFRDQIPETAFNNSFRWTLDINASLITLEHLRYGSSRPVFLFHLTPTDPFTLEAVDAHLCAADTYLGSIIWNPTHINFHWRIIGPLKNDELVYHYT
jgi:hypothetical protein